MISLLFHVFVCALDWYAVWYDQTFVEFPFSEEIRRQKFPFKNRVLFLTWWCLILQTTYFTVALLNDVFGINGPSQKRTPIIRKIKDAMFSLAFPIAIYVSSAFWGIYAIDKQLIFPDHVAKVFPPWLNHTMHTFILAFILIELLLSNRTYPSRNFGVFLVLAFTGSYCVWLNVSQSITGYWVYPVLETMNWFVRTLFFALSIGSGVMIYYLGEKLNNIFSGSPVREGKAKSR